MEDAFGAALHWLTLLSGSWPGEHLLGVGDILDDMELGTCMSTRLRVR